MFRIWQYFPIDDSGGFEGLLSSGIQRCVIYFKLTGDSKEHVACKMAFDFESVNNVICQKMEIFHDGFQLNNQPQFCSVTYNQIQSRTIVIKICYDDR